MAWCGLVKSKQQYRELLEELVSEYCPDNKYCLLKEFLISAHPDPRLLTQLKAIEKYKYEISKKAEKEIDWQETMIQWADNGLAKKFSEVYTPEISFKELYKKLMNENGNGHNGHTGK